MPILLLIAPQQPAPIPGNYNLAQVLQQVYPELNASGQNDLIFWTIDELYEWMDEAAQNLARKCGVFVIRDQSLVSVVNQASYPIPPQQVSTIQVDLGGMVLRPTTIHELEALDALWTSAAPGVPKKFTQDTAGLNQITLYPPPAGPSQGLILGLVMFVFPNQITATNPFVGIPGVLQEYFTFSVLGEARAKETKAAMPEMAQWFRGLVATMENTVTGYWGAGQ